MTTIRTSPRAAAGWAGAGYLAIFVLAVFANFLAVGAVLDRGDARATYLDLASSQTAFRLGLMAFLAVVVIDVVVAWALYVVFRDVHADLSLLAAWSRLIHTAFLGVALVFAFVALLVVREAGPGGAEGQSATQVLLALEAFDLTWVLGLAVFGVHLVLLGRLLARTAHAPWWLGWVLTVAGTAYVLDTVAHLVLADYGAWAQVLLPLVAVPSVVGELALAVWLLLMATGRRAEPVPVRRVIAGPPVDRAFAVR